MNGTHHKHHSRLGGAFAVFVMALSAGLMIGLIALCVLQISKDHNREFAKAQNIERAKLRDAQIAGQRP